MRLENATKFLVREFSCLNVFLLPVSVFAYQVLSAPSPQSRALTYLPIRL